MTIVSKRYIAAALNSRKIQHWVFINVKVKSLFIFLGVWSPQPKMNVNKK